MIKNKKTEFTPSPFPLPFGERIKVRGKRNFLLYPVVAILSVTIVFLVGRFLPHTGIATRNYKEGVYVRRVIDGDTIELSGGEMVRYIGIDTPEIRQRDGSEWIYDPRPYAEKAEKANRLLVEGKRVTLEFDIQKKDKYNRLLAYVYLEDKMANLEMVEQGYAMIYTYPPNLKYWEKFLNAQKEAREKGKGLWKDLEKHLIPASLAKENIGFLRLVETKILSTYLSERVLILNCQDSFKVVIFRNNLMYFPKIAMRSPDAYFRGKAIRVYGIVEGYKGFSEIVLHDPSQLEILE